MENKHIHVLIISQYFPPDVSGGSTRAFNYAKCLSEQGYEITVITAPPHQHADIPKEYRGKLLVKEKMFGFDLIRVWVPSILHSSIKNSTILVASFLASSLFPIFSIRRPDVIIAFEPNLFSIIPAYVYSKLKGGIVINAVDDLWPEALYERGLIKSKILKIILDKLAKFSYNYSKCVIPLNEEVKEIIHKSHGIENNKIEVISHGINIDIFPYEEKKHEESFVVMYSGSLVESYDFDIILESARRLKDKKIKFVIRGKGRLLSCIQEQIKKFQLDNIEIDTNFVPSEKVSKELSKADILLAPMTSGFSHNLSLPTKILEYQAVGRPIICSSDGAIGNYIDRTESGIRVKIRDTDAFVDAILKLNSDPTLCRTMGNNARMFVEHNLTFEKIGKQLSKTISFSLKDNKHD